MYIAFTFYFLLFYLFFGNNYLAQMATFLLEVIKIKLKKHCGPLYGLQFAPLATDRSLASGLFLLSGDVVIVYLPAESHCEPRH